MAYRLMSKTSAILHLVVFRPCDNLILQLFRHIIEIVGITSHTYQQIPVFIGMLLRIMKSRRIYDIKLNMMTAKLKVRPDE